MKTLYLECNMGAAGDMLMGRSSGTDSGPGKISEKTESGLASPM